MTAKSSSRTASKSRREPKRRDDFPSRRESAPSDTFRKPVKKEVVSVDDEYIKKIGEIKEAFKAVLFNADKEIVAECGVAELAKKLDELDTVSTIVFDGVITQRLVDSAVKKSTRLIIGAAVADIENKTNGLQIVTFEDLGL